ncbi:MAG: hypothetical protein ACI91O_001750 [Candidatus Poriferisodalaceae bacterium]|jgi:hypothetical protein
MPVTLAISQLNTALSAALGVDWDDVDGQELVDDLNVLLSAGARLGALMARVSGAMDRSQAWAEAGKGSAVALLRSMAPNHHKSAASRAVRNGERLRRMPLVAESFEGGRITSDHVRVFGELLHKRFEDRFPEFEKQLVEAAETLRFDQFCRLIERWKDTADRSEPDKRDQQDLDAREVHLSRTFNNRGSLTGTLTPIAAFSIGNELDRLSDILFDQEWAEATERLGAGKVTKHDLTRTPAQRRHDAMLLMAQRSSRVGEDPKLPIPLLYVHCTVAELHAALEADAGGTPVPVSFDEGMCEIEDHTPISHKMLVRLAVQAEVKRVVIDPKSLEMEMGRAARFFTSAQHEALAVRDRVCECGCGISARRCEADHIVEVRDDGLTNIDNGNPKCRKSHRLKTNQRTRNGPPKLILRT